MRCVVQRVSQASVKVESQIVGSIQRGLLVLLGVENGDSSRDLAYSASKISGLRIFPDEEGLMNKSVLDIGGQVLVVSQFTLLGDVRKGKRPSFMAAAAPEIASTMYQQFCDLLQQAGLVVETGQFQADMQVELINDGPVTLVIDSRKVL